MQQTVATTITCVLSHVTVAATIVDKYNAVGAALSSFTWPLLNSVALLAYESNIALVSPRCQRALRYFAEALSSNERQSFQGNF